MLAVRIARSDPERGGARASHLEAHKAYLRSTQLRIVFSGPVLDENASAVGALILADVDDLEEMRRFSTGDPFVQNGVYGRVDIYCWEVTIDSRQRLLVGDEHQGGTKDEDQYRPVCEADARHGRGRPLRA